MSPPTYTDYQRRLLPAPLLGEKGTAYAETLGAVKDELLARVKEAAKARFPTHAPADALPKIGADRRLERGMTESEADFRARLKQAFSVHVWAGTRRGIQTHTLAPAGFLTTRIYSNRDWRELGGVPPDGNLTFFSRLWIVLANPIPWSRIFIDSTWSIGATDRTIGSTATTADVAMVRRLLKRVKSARDTLVGIFVVFGDEDDVDSVPATAWNEETDVTFAGDPHIFWPGS